MRKIYGVGLYDLTPILTKIKDITIMTKNCCPTNNSVDTSRCLSVKDLLEKQFTLNDNLQIGKAWVSRLSTDHFRTAILGELGELIDQPTAPQYKWWKSKDPDTYSEWMTKLELVDAAHFFLSIAILNILSMRKGACFNMDDVFLEFDDMYAGVDQQTFITGVALVEHPNVLNHGVYNHLRKELLSDEWDYYNWVDTLNLLVSCMGMTCAEFSALYTAKATLNEVRWQHPEWEKISVDGVEDNERLFGLVESFLADTSMTLTTLRQNVLNEFYTQ